MTPTTTPVMGPTALGDETCAARHGQAFAPDARRLSEHVAGHVPGTVLTPLGEPAGRLGALPRSRRVHAVRAGSDRGPRAAGAVTGAGLDVVPVAGAARASMPSRQPLAAGQAAGLRS